MGGIFSSTCFFLTTRLASWGICLLTFATTGWGQGHGELSVQLQELATLGKDPKHGFVQVGDVVTDSKGFIYVTDRFQYSIGKFSPGGIYKRAFGKRGNGRGEFRAVPYQMTISMDTLAVAEAGTDRVQFFSTDFKLVGEMNASGPIVDIVCSLQGALYASVIPLSGDKGDILAEYDRSGRIVARFPLEDATGKPAFDMTCLCVDRNNRLIVVYRYINKVLVWSEGHAVSFSVNSVPPRAGENTEFQQKLGSLPEGTLFSDVAADNEGHILILGGDYSTHPNRDVYVVDYSGKLECILILPDESGVLYIDSTGFLYTREQHRRIVKKYKIEYSFPPEAEH